MTDLSFFAGLLVGIFITGVVSLAFASIRDCVRVEQSYHEWREIQHAPVEIVEERDAA